MPHAARHTGDPEEGYFHRDRSHFLDWVGGRYESVLEIGCAAGENASWYRRHGARRLVGIEVHSYSASLAANSFDDVRAMRIEDALPDLEGPFELIVCADVLEHLIDPWSVAAGLRSLAHDRTVLAVSIPNIRYYRAVARIAIGRGFDYDPEGIFDATHLRFFTRANVEAMLYAAGWQAVRWGGFRPTLARFGAALSLVTRGWSDEWLNYQWYVVASPRTPVGSHGGAKSLPPIGKDG